MHPTIHVDKDLQRVAEWSTRAELYVAAAHREIPEANLAEKVFALGKQSPSVVVVIPNWNGEDFLAECLDSLVRQSYPYLKILVVDNGSQDRSLEILEHFGAVEVIRLDRNYGLPAV